LLIDQIVKALRNEIVSRREIICPALLRYLLRRHLFNLI
jgi:hypothetical protein